MNQVPNLDALDQKSLMEFWWKFHRPTNTNAAELVGDRRRGFRKAASALANYACNKSVAISCRLKGDVATALHYEEHVLQLSYDRIPEDLRW